MASTPQHIVQLSRPSLAGAVSRGMSARASHAVRFDAAITARRCAMVQREAQSCRPDIAYLVAAGQCACAGE